MAPSTTVRPDGNRIQEAQQTDGAKISGKLQDTIDQLLAALGVPPDMLGSPRMTPEVRTQMQAMVADLSPAERSTLSEMAAAKQLSDYETRDPILPRSYERVLEQILQQAGSGNGPSTPPDML